METQTENPTQLAELELCAKDATALAPAEAERQAIVTTLVDIVPRIPKYTLWADTVTCDSVEDAEAINAMLEQIQQDNKTADAVTDPWCSRANKHHKRITGLRGLIADPLTAAFKKAKGIRDAYYRREKEKAEEEARQKQAEADRKQREEEEALRREAKRKEEEAARAKTEETRQRKLQEAADLQERAASVPKPVIHVEPPKKAEGGPRSRTMWKARVENQQQFFDALAKDKNLWGYVEIKVTAMQANKQRNSTMTIPGILFWEQQV